MLVGAVIKVVSAYFLIGNPAIGAIGAPISTFLCNLSVVLLNLCFAAKLCEIPDLIGFFLRPLLAAVFSVGVGFVSYHVAVAQLGESAILTLLTLVAVMLVYFALACLTRAVTAEELQALPMGDRLLQLLDRFGASRSDGRGRTSNRKDVNKNGPQ